MGYPTTPVTFTLVNAGENPSPVANLLGAEVTAIETALLHSAAQTTAPIRMRQGGNLIEWGPSTPGKLSVLGSTNGKSFIGLGCEAGSTPGTFTTRALKGVVLTHDGAAGLLIQSVPLVGTPNQTPVTRLTITKAGVPIQANPVLLAVSNISVSVPTGVATWVNATFPTVSLDPHGFYTGNATGDFKVPVNYAGVYLFIASLTWAANVNGNRLARFFCPATAVFYTDQQICDPDGGAFAHQVVMTRQLGDNEVFNVQLEQTSGVTLTVNVNVRGLRLL